MGNAPLIYYAIQAGAMRITRKSIATNRAQVGRSGGVPMPPIRKVGKLARRQSCTAVAVRRMRLRGRGNNGPWILISSYEIRYDLALTPIAPRQAGVLELALPDAKVYPLPTWRNISTHSSR